MNTLNRFILAAVALTGLTLATPAQASDHHKKHKHSSNQDYYGQNSRSYSSSYSRSHYYSSYDDRPRYYRSYDRPVVIDDDGYYNDRYCGRRYYPEHHSHGFLSFLFGR